MFITPIEPMRRRTLEDIGDIGAPAPAAAPDRSVQNVLSPAAQNLAETQRVANEDSYQLALGNADNLGAIMVNMLKAESAVQTTVQLTSRVVAAYKEILQIQV
ncbi:MAG: flagellar hook-basal body complex protein FliE [Peptococcaceae bacterium]|jgi:flagellar hook-basal body complex protein FliE|nr:flagellar hook-basal body complex protein FliE [Peptococcaceae bacterium]